MLATLSAAEERLARLDILLVEDEPDIREALAETLSEQGHRVIAAGDGAEAMARLDERAFDLAICDVRLPHVDGLTIFQRIQRESPQSSVVLMSAFGSVAEAVAAIQAKAAHYLAKPFSPDALLDLVARVAAERGLRRLFSEAGDGPASGERTPLIGESPAMTRVRERIAAVAKSDGAVLITGESGTGKELAARRLHELSSRAAGPFVALNCAAFPDTLLEAELFGHERGAYTGAVARRDGRFKAAHGGTLFLDEVADLSPSAQAKLLRVLEDGGFQPLGGTKTLQIDVRIVSATNSDARQLVAQGRFREDIYHRLKVFHIQLPALRERRGDLPLLVDHFRRKLGREPLVFSPRALAALRHYPFPGNVRELKHVVEHACALAPDGEIDLAHLPEELAGDACDTPPSRPFQPLADAARLFEREYLVRALRHCDNQRARTAELLGISRKTLWQKLKQHGVGAGDGDGEQS